MLEKRAHIRHGVEGTVNLKPEGGAPLIIKADLADICFGGLGVYSKEKIESGVDVAFELTTKLWHEPVIGRGKIGYSKEIKGPDGSIFKLGIQFIDVDKEALRCIITHARGNICAETRKKHSKKHLS